MALGVTARRLSLFLLVSILLLTVHLFLYPPANDEPHELSEISLMPLDGDISLPLTLWPNKARLGNQMFSFATLLGLSLLNNRTLLVPTSMHAALTPYFDIHCKQVNLLHFVRLNSHFIDNWLTVVDQHIAPNCNVVMGNVYPTSYTFFWKHKEEVMRHFTFRSSLSAHARKVLNHVREIRPDTQTIVGIHVRRGDYVRHCPGCWLQKYQGREVDLEFFLQAIVYFRSRFLNVTFVAASDDRDWLRRELSPLGVLTLPDVPTPGHDLAILSLCHHVITSYGTFGWWAGFLSGGRVVYFDDFLRPNTNMTNTYFRYDKIYPPEWVGISTTPQGYWDNYTNPFASTESAHVLMLSFLHVMCFVIVLFIGILFARSFGS